MRETGEQKGKKIIFPDVNGHLDLQGSHSGHYLLKAKFHAETLDSQYTTWVDATAEELDFHKP
jgi:hypothetical protein